MTTGAAILAPDLARAVAAQRDRLDLDLIARAYQVSAQAHRGQKRVSGDDFHSHSVAVATVLADQQLDSTTIAAALLHDVVEDSNVTLDDIRREFGTEVADLVDGLTKIASLTFRSSAEEQAENYRKLLLSIARDARVIIIKLADRLHNMRTLEHLPEERRRRIALETREIYAPLAHRFGMAGVKAELEDLAFKFLEPADYHALLRKIKERKGERERTIERLRIPLTEELAAEIDVLEENLFGAPASDMNEGILRLKRGLSALRRIVCPQRDPVPALTRDGFRAVPAEVRPYLRDVYDRLARVSDLLDSFRDEAATLLDLHVALASNRLNQVIKVLTVIATIMLPLTVITSYYGMNFRLPEFAWSWGWLYVMGLLAATAFGTWWYLRRRRWD